MEIQCKHEKNLPRACKGREGQISRIVLKIYGFFDLYFFSKIINELRQWSKILSTKQGSMGQYNFTPLYKFWLKTWITNTLNLDLNKFISAKLALSDPANNLAIIFSKFQNSHAEHPRLHILTNSWLNKWNMDTLKPNLNLSNNVLRRFDGPRPLLKEWNIHN